MAEKIDPLVDRPFSARSPGALAGLITEIVAGTITVDQRRLDSLALARIEADEGNFARHWAVYRGTPEAETFSLAGV